MPRRRRVSKRRTLSPGEQFLAAIEEGLPPNSLVRRGPDELDVELMAGDVDFADGRVELDELDDEAQGGDT